MGRPTSLNDLVEKRFCDAVAVGNTRRNAAAAAGISFSAVKEWMRRGRAGEEPYAAFLSRVESADGKAENDAVQCILSAARDGSWQAAAWWLERRRRKTWRRPPMPVERPETEDLSGADEAALWAAAEQGLAKRKGATGT